MKNKQHFLHVVFIVVSSMPCFSQSWEDDKQLLRESLQATPDKVNNTKKVFNPVAASYLGFLKFYKQAISPQWGTNCVFDSTCSVFSKNMVQKYGFVKGYFLSIDRISRCNQITIKETPPYQLTLQGKVKDETFHYQLHEQQLPSAYRDQSSAADTVSISALPHASLAFIQYLVNRKQYVEAVGLLNSKLKMGYATDSIHYFLGYLFYTQQHFVSSLHHLNSVRTTQTKLYNNSRLLGAFQQACLGDYIGVKKTLAAMQSSDSLHYQMRLFELAGTALLEKNWDTYKNLRAQINSGWTPIQSQIKKFDELENVYKKTKKKSMAAAGFMSAVVPGLGKYYAGKKGNALYVFLTTSLLGVQAYESYRKAGINSWRFYVFGGLFTSFYISNIWGSAIAVHVQKSVQTNAIKNEILVNMHIPLRNILR